MRFILLLILILNLFDVKGQGISHIRDLYHKSPFDEIACDSLNIVLENNNKTNQINAYIGAYYMIKSKFLGNPIIKIKHFNKGKELLEVSIENEPNSIELIFLRYSIQKNIPKFLMYSSNLSSDLEFIEKNLSLLDDIQLKELITNSLNELNK